MYEHYFSSSGRHPVPDDLAFLYLLAEKFSCSTMFSKNEFGIVSDLRFISMKNSMLS